METLVLCLMGAAGLTFVLKLSLASSHTLRITLATTALFMGLSWPWAAEQSKTQIAAWLADPALMRDTAVLLSFDVVLLFLFCRHKARALTATPSLPPSRHPHLHRWSVCLLNAYPTLLIFPVLFALLVRVLFALPGVNFSLAAWGVAAGSTLALMLTVWGVRALLPETELRLELLFLALLLIALLGIVGTVHGGTAVEATSNTDLHALLLVAICFVGCALMGLALEKFKSYRRSKTSIHPHHDLYNTPSPNDL